MQRLNGCVLAAAVVVAIAGGGERRGERQRYLSGTSRLAVCDASMRATIRMRRREAAQRKGRVASD